MGGGSTALQQHLGRIPGRCFETVEEVHIPAGMHGEPRVRSSGGAELVGGARCMSYTRVTPGSQPFEQNDMQVRYSSNKRRSIDHQNSSRPFQQHCAQRFKRNGARPCACAITMLCCAKHTLTST